MSMVKRNQVRIIITFLTIFSFLGGNKQNSQIESVKANEALWEVSETLEDGKRYLVTATTKNDDTYYLKAEGFTNNTPGIALDFETISFGDAWIVNKVEDNIYTFISEEGYVLYHNNAGTLLSKKVDDIQNNHLPYRVWTFDNNKLTNNNRYVTFSIVNNPPSWMGSSSSVSSNVSQTLTFYTLKAEGEALLYGYDFLRLTAAECATKEVSVETWSLLEDMFNILSEDGQTIIKNTLPLEDGNDLEEALLRYHYIINKYAYNDFINQESFEVREKASNKARYVIIPPLLMISLCSFFLYRYFTLKRYQS